MNAHLQRALLLLEQSRYDMAEDELRQVLADEPENAMAHAVMAICLNHREKFNDAVSAAETGIHLAPDQPFPYYAFSIVLSGRNQYTEAQNAVETAIGIDPYNVSYFAQLAQTLFNQRQWQSALEAAESGLDLDPEDVGCTNLRAMSLVKLGKNIEAAESIDTALKRAPEDSFSHANMGWSQLEQNQPQKAMEHFREALRLNPQMEWARLGIIESMKAKYFIYRWMLNWFLWMAKLQQKAQWGVILGAYLGYRVLLSVADANPALAPWIRPILVAYITFAVMTWLSNPLFNLVLRTSKFGRLALSSEEIKTSTRVGLCVLGAITLLVAFFATGSTVLLGPALACALIIPPISAIYNCDEGWPRAVLSLITLALGGLAVVIIATMLGSFLLEGRSADRLASVGRVFAAPFFVGAVATQFLVGYLATVQPQRGSDAAKWVWRIGGAALILGAILAVGFVVIGVLYAVGEDTPVFTSPIRLHPIPLADASWTNDEQVATDTARFTNLGFKVVGDYAFSDFSNVKSRLLWNEEQLVAMDISEDELSQHIVSFVSKYDDGQYFAYGISPTPSPASPPTIERKMFVDETSESVYQQFLKNRPQNNQQAFRETIIDELKKTYQLQLDYTLSRGGPTDDEIVAVAESMGLTASDKIIGRFQRSWREQAYDRVRAFVIENLDEQKQAEVDGQQIICINELLSENAVLDQFYRKEILRQNGYGYGRKMGDRMITIAESESRRDAFNSIVQEFDIVGLSLVCTVDEPIPTDVYVLQGD